MKICPHCGNKYSNNDFYCLKDNYPLIDYSNEQMAKEQALSQQITNKTDNPNIPKCPTCQSTNIKKISTTSKIIHGLTFGIFSTTARSQFQCQNCGYKW